MSNEEYYDEHVAPLLLKAAELCRTRNMPLVSQVEYEAGMFGLTSCRIDERASLGIQMLYWMAQAGSNIDAFYVALKRYMRGKRHNSVMLNLLGIPEEG